MYSFVVVSNRLPVNVARVDGKLIFKRSDGGLATAMSSLDIEGKIWIGWPGIPADDLTSKEKRQIATELKKYGCVPVHLTREQIALFYEGYANDTLWPLFHYFPTYAQYETAYWDTYQRVNTLFARAIKRVAYPTATVWIQDYQLMLLPALTRQYLPAAKIGYFHHVPFPSYEVFRLLPQRRAIIEGLLGADLLGFHIYDYARHFNSSANRLLGTTGEHGLIEYQGRRVKADAFPIGIDYQLWRSKLREPETRAEIKRLDDLYAGQKVIISADRLDYSKGIMKRLIAYEKFLSDNPRYHKKVVLVVIASPSRVEVETYKKLRDEIEVTVSRINGIYSTGDWSPISYQFQTMPLEDLVALYARADVALITPLRDGMNLMAKEYLACKRPRPGVLILSEMAGAADELVEAIQVNPNDIDALSDAILEAFRMPKSEQLTRIRAMQERIESYSVQHWGRDFIDELDKAHESHRGALHKRLASQQKADLLSHYKKAASRLILLDYDGTLHGFSTRLSAAAVRPSAKLKNQLRHIADTPHTAVCIISGRPSRVLDAWFGDIPGLILVAEHGAWIRQKGTWRQYGQSFDRTAIVAAMKRAAARTAGALVEEKESAVVWHYRRVNPEMAFVRNADLSRELREIVADSDLGVFSGNKILEVKPKNIHKGAIAEKLYQEHTAEFVFAAGDDYTDEDMFKALPHDAYTVKVGFGTTHARFQVSKLERILELIETMSKITVSSPRK